MPPEQGKPTRIKWKKCKPLTILREIGERILSFPTDVDEGSRQFPLNPKGQVIPAGRRTLQTFNGHQWHCTYLCVFAKVVRNHSISLQRRVFLQKMQETLVFPPKSLPSEFDHLSSGDRDWQLPVAVRLWCSEVFILSPSRHRAIIFLPQDYHCPTQWASPLRAGSS